jgi:hypothetical protein
MKIIVYYIHFLLGLLLVAIMFTKTKNSIFKKIKNYFNLLIIYYIFFVLAYIWIIRLTNDLITSFVILTLLEAAFIICLRLLIKKNISVPIKNINIKIAIIYMAFVIFVNILYLGSIKSGKEYVITYPFIIYWLLDNINYSFWWKKK